MSKKNPGEYVWDTFTAPVYVKDMPRERIRKAMQFCLKNNFSSPGGYYVKDGLDIQEWITIFTVKLLDPTVK